jgi:hypothetical protein
MDLRPLVPWVFSQLGGQPDGVGRPCRRVAGGWSMIDGLTHAHLRIVYGKGKFFINY